jgi:hypothetical protein
MYPGVQDNGNVVIRSNIGGVTWQTGTAGKGGSAFAMQADGNLVLYK